MTGPPPPDWRPVPDPTVLTTQALLREIEHLREAVEAEFRNLRALLDERYATQTKAVDAAFVAQQEAMRTALESAEKAVTKAEIATEKRFTIVDELRGLLTEQGRAMLTRAEADVRLKATNEKVAQLEASMSRGLSRDEYGAAHEAIRQATENLRSQLSEHRSYDIEQFGKIGGDISSLRSRYAGISVALGVIMTVLIVLVTVVELTKK